jgi:hypothetical protein
MSRLLGSTSRKVGLAATLLAAGGLGCLGIPPLSQTAPAGADDPVALQSNGIQNMGSGMYTDPSVAQQLSAFTITPTLVSCGVGTMAFPVPGQLGPFSMLMYSTKITSYTVDPGAPGKIVAKGRMRSITRMGNQTNEDVEHDFIAIAEDHGGHGPDTFVVHFKTPFWNHGNMMATKSKVQADWVQFGGAVSTDLAGAAMGDILVGK